MNKMPVLKVLVKAPKEIYFLWGFCVIPKYCGQATKEHGKGYILKGLTSRSNQEGAAFFIKTKDNKRSARVLSKKVTISNTTKGLTSQAVLVPVLKLFPGKFLRQALRSGKSSIAARQCRAVDVDSADKTTYGKQQ